MIGELRDSLDDKDVPLTPEQLAELDRRLAAMEDERGDMADWPALRDEMARRIV